MWVWIGRIISLRERGVEGTGKSEMGRNFGARFAGDGGGYVYWSRRRGR